MVQKEMLQATMDNSKDCLDPPFPALNEIFHLFDKALGGGSRRRTQRSKLGLDTSAPDARMLAHATHLCSVVKQHHYFAERLWAQTRGAAKNLLTLLSFGTVPTETWLLTRLGQAQPLSPGPWSEKGPADPARPAARSRPP